MKFSTVFISSLVGSVSAFSPALYGGNSATTRANTALGYVPEHFDRAVECATTVGECDLEELESLANELEMNQDSLNGINKNEHDSSEVLRVKEILRAQQKFVALNEEYQKELQAAKSAKDQIVSWPAEEDVAVSAGSDFGYQYPPQKDEETAALMETQQDIPASKKREQKTLLPMQVVYEDAKYSWDIGDGHPGEYGPYARQLNYQGQDYFD